MKLNTKAVLKYLKSQHPFGYANEIFDTLYVVARDDLKLSELKLRTGECKNNVTRKYDSENSSVVFKFNSSSDICLDRLIYNEEYKTVDINLADSYVGTRK